LLLYPHLRVIPRSYPLLYILYEILLHFALAPITCSGQTDRVCKSYISRHSPLSTIPFLSFQLRWLNVVHWGLVSIPKNYLYATCLSRRELRYDIVTITYAQIVAHRTQRHSTDTPFSTYLNFQIIT
jgi:hypothetical protein